MMENNLSLLWRLILYSLLTPAIMSKCCATATLGLHLGFSAKLRIWQVSGRKMEPWSGISFGQNQPDTANPTTHRFILKMWGVPPSASKTCLNLLQCPHPRLNN